MTPEHIPTFGLAMADNINSGDSCTHFTLSAGEASQAVYTSRVYPTESGTEQRLPVMSAQSFAEMRMEPRWQLKSTVSVFIQGNKECIGLLVNWSENGLMLSGYQPLKLGEKLSIELVDIIKDKGRRSAPCEVEVVWSQELTPSLFGNGCRIISGSDMLDVMMKDYRHDS
jgi:hypothetical protein